MSLFDELKQEQQDSGHRNKCVVIMCAILTGKSYSECLSRLDARLERPVNPKGGYYPSEWRPVLSAMLMEQGKRLEEVHIGNVRHYAKTTRTFTQHVARALSVRDGFVISTRHVSAVKDYQMLDWADNRLKRILKVWRVVPLVA